MPLPPTPAVADTCSHFSSAIVPHSLDSNDCCAHLLTFSRSLPACNCNGRSNRCYFDQELWQRTGHGGHCLECRDNTDGPNCERCRENFYQTMEGHCVACNCDPTGQSLLFDSTLRSLTPSSLTHRFKFAAVQCSRPVPLQARRRGRALRPLCSESLRLLESGMQVGFPSLLQSPRHLIYAWNHFFQILWLLRTGFLEQHGCL